jgi:hypothetical protein
MMLFLFSGSASQAGRQAGRFSSLSRRRLFREELVDSRYYYCRRNAVA